MVEVRQKRLGEEQVSTTVEGMRRLAVAKQHLAGERPKHAAKGDILDVVRDQAFVQWDPVTVVAPSHVISFWSRIGDFRISDLDRLLWDEKKLVLHWTPIASLVLAEDQPIYRSFMERYPESLTRSWGAQSKRAKEFLRGHGPLRGAILRKLQGGPMLASEFEQHVKNARNQDGWSNDSEVSTMLFHLLMMGEVMVVGHRGNQNLWGLSEEFLPGWTKGGLTEGEAEARAAERAIRAVGTATPSEIHYYYLRGRYQNLKLALERLQGEGTISQVTVSGLKGREPRYIHRDDIDLLEGVSGSAWQPRTSLIPPFDTLISGRGRTNTVFGFDYVHEQFLPKNKRRFGTYVLPIVHGERIIGRIDPKLDKEEKTLVVNSVHAEPRAPGGREVGNEVGEAIEGLASFVGAREVVYTPRVPPAWKSALR